MRSPCPLKADLSYRGMEVSVWARRLVKRELARGMSWVPGFVSMDGRLRGREGHTGLPAVLDQRVRRIGFC